MNKSFRLAVLVAAAVVSLNSYGMSDSYKFCAISGYYAAAGDQFLGGLALHKQLQVVENGNDATCLALFKQGRDAYTRMQKSGKVTSQADKEIMNAVGDFQTAIYAAVLKVSGM